MSGFGRSLMIHAVAQLFAAAARFMQPSFGQSYGANPRSTGNGGRRGLVAASKRAACKRKQQRARANKQRPAKLAKKQAAQRARRAGR